MSQINLNRTVDDFYSSCNNLNNPDSQDIVNYKKKYLDTLGRLDEFNAKVGEVMNNWKADPANFASEEASNTAKDPVKVHHQARLIKNGSVAIQILATCIGMIACMSLTASSTFVFNTVALVGGLSTVIAFNPAKIKEKLGLNSRISPRESLSKARQFLSQKIALLINNFKVIRQNRLNESRNFQDFVQRFVNINGFMADEKILLNTQLHAFYIKYKFTLKSMINEKCSVMKPAIA